MHCQKKDCIIVTTTLVNVKPLLLPILLTYNDPSHRREHWPKSTKYIEKRHGKSEIDGWVIDLKGTQFLSLIRKQERNEP